MWSTFWNLRVSDRLAQWRSFRQKLSNMPLLDALTEVNVMWSSAPFVTYYLQPDSARDWPDPWALIAENYYCDIAKALGIIYTIYFTSHKNVNIELRIYYDFETKDRINVVYVDDGKYILNYWPFEIVNTQQIEEKNLKLLYVYTVVDLQLDKY